MRKRNEGRCETWQYRTGFENLKKESSKGNLKGDLNMEFEEKQKENPEITPWEAIQNCDCESFLYNLYKACFDRNWQFGVFDHGFRKSNHFRDIL